PSCYVAPALGLLLPAALLPATLDGCAGGPTPVPSGSGGPAAAAAPPPTRFPFVGVARGAAIPPPERSGPPGQARLPDPASPGLALIDFDRDGHIDAFVLNTWKLSDGVVVEKGRNGLYRNRGDGTFEDVTDRAGVGGDGRWACGVAVADYDNDGWPDILVTNF